MPKRIRIGRIYDEARTKRGWSLSEINYVFDTPLEKILPEYKELKGKLDDQITRILDLEKSRTKPEIIYEPYPEIERAKEIVARNNKVSSETLRRSFNI